MKRLVSNPFEIDSQYCCECGFKEKQCKYMCKLSLYEDIVEKHEIESVDELDEILCEYDQLLSEQEIFKKNYANLLKYKTKVETRLEKEKQENVQFFMENATLKNELSGALYLPDGFKLGQKVYMIPTETNGLKRIVSYKILSYSMTSLGIRVELSVVKKSKGIEPFYAASIEMFKTSIFASEDMAKKYLKEEESEL